jgi:capsular polysaccharide biosynthesis protein
MSNQKVLCQESTSIRKLPINFNQSDSKLFEHELEKLIPKTTLLHFEDVVVNPDGMLFHGTEILTEYFPTQDFMDNGLGFRDKLKLLVRYYYLFKPHKVLDRDLFWITDIWSQVYFHWMTDALPRLFMIRDKIVNSTLLLPAAYQKEDFVVSSLKPFSIGEIKFIQETFRCKNLNIPTHTAPTGNYNETIVRSLRDIYADYYHKIDNANITSNKIYISRGKAQKRKILNEEVIIAILEEYGFKTVYFEEWDFEQQAKIALNAQYLISNHGSGLTNMLFMKSGSSIFELRKRGDLHNNCYFALASSLNLNYFYQICDSENPSEDANTGNLIIEPKLLRKNIEHMLYHQ